MNLVYSVQGLSLLPGLEQGSKDPRPWSNNFSMLDPVFRKLCYPQDITNNSVRIASNDIKGRRRTIVLV